MPELRKGYLEVRFEGVRGRIDPGGQVRTGGFSGTRTAPGTRALGSEVKGPGSFAGRESCGVVMGSHQDSSVRRVGEETA